MPNAHNGSDAMPGDSEIKQLFRIIGECNSRKAASATEAKKVIDNAVEQHGLNKAALMECIRLAKWSKAKRDAYRAHRDHYFTLLGLDGDAEQDEQPRRGRREELRATA
jgi:hypothetical protein